MGGEEAIGEVGQEPAGGADPLCDVADDGGCVRLHPAGLLVRTGAQLFERIEAADWNAIVGLPLLRLAQELRTLGFELP